MRVAAITTAVSILISGCGGGSGNPILQQSGPYPVPFYTPIEVSKITPLHNSKDAQWAIADLSAVSLTGQGDNLVVTGFESQPTTSATWNNFQIHVFGWQNNKFVNQTTSWFSTNENIIPGTNSAKFSDLDNNGKLDMVIAPYTDGALTGVKPAYVFFNSNNKFTRVDIPLNISPTELARNDSKTYVESHDFVVVDLNQDGHKDIVIGDYGHNTVLAFNNGNHTFSTYTQKDRNLPGSSSLAVADFLNNGSYTILAVDQQVHANNRAGLYSWQLNDPDLLFTQINLGPLPRFELPKWDSYNLPRSAAGHRSHEVRVVANDWNTDGVMDAIVLSRPWCCINGDWPKYSEIQFLKNNGSGTFSDETDNVLVGYNTASVVSYNPRFIDINGDALIDILLPTAGDFSGANNSSQILLKTSDGKFVAAYQNVLTDFSSQSNAIAGVANAGNTVNIIQSPENKNYLVTAVKLENNQMAVYLSLIGENVTTATQAVSTITARWPWMSDAAANAVLSRTSKTYLNGHILDVDAALSPIGELQIKNLSINGHISGILPNMVEMPLQAVDSLGRNFSVNISPTVTNDSNWWSKNTVPDQLTPKSQTEYLIGGSNFEYDNLRFGGKDSNWSIGTPLIPVIESTFVSAQITTLNYNPWIQLSGMWGSVNYSSMFESVVTHKKDYWQNQFGYIYTTTNMNPGLITKIDNFHAVWLETGYATERFGFFTGVRPWIVNGGVNAELPTGVDTQGNLQYTNLHFKVNNPVNMYLRTVYTDKITKNLAYKISGMYVDNGQYRTQFEIKFSY